MLKITKLVDCEAVVNDLSVAINIDPAAREATSTIALQWSLSVPTPGEYVVLFDLDQGNRRAQQNNVRFEIDNAPIQFATLGNSLIAKINATSLKYEWKVHIQYKEALQTASRLEYSLPLKLPYRILNSSFRIVVKQSRFGAPTIWADWLRENPTTLPLPPPQSNGDYELEMSNLSHFSLQNSISIELREPTPNAPPPPQVDKSSHPADPNQMRWFDVKEKPRKKGGRPTEKRLGVSLHEIVIQDVKTGRVEKTRPLTQLRRWAATAETLTLDFGDYEDDYTVLQTTQAEDVSLALNEIIQAMLDAKR